MRWNLTSLLVSALVAHRALAELNFTVVATHKGSPIPQSEIKFEHLDLGLGRHGQVTPPESHRRVKRSNPTANSSNWCGSVNTTPTTNPITVIHTIYQQPTCSIRSSSSYPQVAASWAGIDGDTWTSALLQAGTLCQIDSSTSGVTYQAWWQWVPDSAYTITTVPVSAGDWIEVTITATSDTAASIEVSNTSQSYSTTINVSSGPTLERVNADWILERPSSGGSLTGFPQFTDNWFEEAYADLTTSGTTLGILGATQFQIPNLCASQEYDNADEDSWSL